MIWEDEIDEDEERHRPLLDLGIPMDFKAHGVDNFKAQLEELERGVLMLNHLGKSPPPSPYECPKFSTLSSSGCHHQAAGSDRHGSCKPRSQAH